MGYKRTWDAKNNVFGAALLEKAERTIMLDMAGKTIEWLYQIFLKYL